MLVSRLVQSAPLLTGLVLSGVTGCSNNNAGDSSTFDSGFRIPVPHRDATTDGHRADTGIAFGLDGSKRKDQGAPEACAPQSVAVDMSPVDMLILLDRSASMADGGAWADEVLALESFVQDARSKGIGVGIQYMPLAASCDPTAYAQPAVPVGDLPDAGAAITASLSSAPPSGGRPMVPALQGAIAYAKAQQQSNPGRSIVLVLSTDGLPDSSCATDAGLTNTTQNAAKVLSAAAAATPPIRTFVIGIGNVPSLDQLAVAGGTGKAIVVGATDAGDASSLQAQLTQAFASDPVAGASVRVRHPGGHLGGLRPRRGQRHLQPVAAGAGAVLRRERIDGLRDQQLRLVLRRRRGTRARRALSHRMHPGQVRRRRRDDQDRLRLPDVGAGAVGSTGQRSRATGMIQ